MSPSAPLLLVLALGAAALAADCSNSISSGSVDILIDGVLKSFPVLLSGGVTSWGPKAVVSGTSVTTQHGARWFLGKPNTCPTSMTPDIIDNWPLLGASLGWTMDLSKNGCGCNAAVYFTKPPAYDKSGNAVIGQSSDYYCDANQVGGTFCPEIDLVEANTHAFQWTPHKCAAPTAASGSKFYDACDKWGCGNHHDNRDGYGPGQKIDTSKPFNVEFKFVQQNNQLFDMEFNISQGANSFTAHFTDDRKCWMSPEMGKGANQLIRPYMADLTDSAKAGMNFIVSNWGDATTNMSWLDTPPCDASLTCVKNPWLIKDIWYCSDYTKCTKKAPTPTPTPTPTPKSTIPLAPKADNPYTKYPMIYVNPTYAAMVVAAEANHADIKCKMETIRKTPSFIWLDRISKVSKLSGYMTEAKAQGAAIQIVVYDLPNRDCAALSSNGELLVAQDGLNKYKTQYIDAIKAVLDQFPTVPVIMVIEPDSLPNLVTNMNLQKCQEAASSYKEGIAYALSKLAGPNHYQYIDAAHECWLGWENNMNGFPPVIKAVFELATDTSSVRGFSTNVANYQNLHLFSGNTGCGDSNPVQDHAKYIDVLTAKMVSSGVFSSTPTTIIDTARNGAKEQRSKPGNWCNIKTAGIGAFHKAGGDGTVSNVDAYVWVKPPGESDGTSDTSAPRYDAHCGSVDSLTPAPEAGEWFDAHFVQLVSLAVPAVVADAACSGGSPSPCTVSGVPAGASGVGTCASVDAGKSCDLVCQSGYTKVSGKCASDGTWATAPSCQSSAAATCSITTVPAGASSLGTCASVDAGKSCDLVCQSGYTKVSGQCGRSGAWSTEPSCKANAPATCAFALPDHATGQGTCASKQASGTTCDVVCESGYNAIMGVCSSGTWTTQPACAKASGATCALSMDGLSAAGTCKLSQPSGTTCAPVCEGTDTPVTGTCSDGTWVPKPSCAKQGQQGTASAAAAGLAFLVALACGLF